jgi:hypothetical protein
MGIHMKLTSLFRGLEKSTMKLSENQVFSVRGKNVQISCLYGDLWITWPKRGETILKSGQTILVSTTGKICIAALSDAFFQMRKKSWFAHAQPHGESSVENNDADMLMN